MQCKLKNTLFKMGYTNKLFIVQPRWPKYDDHDNVGNEKDHQDYHALDDNNYVNEISDKVYNWEDIGEFGKDHLSTSAEVINVS